MRSVELLVVLAVTALHLPVVTWGVGTDELVADTELFQLQFKESRFVGAFGQKAVGKLGAVVRPNAFNEMRFFHDIAQESCREIGVVFLKSLDIAKPAV